jgi:hypothetical protein
VERGEILNAISANRIFTLASAVNPKLVLRGGSGAAGRVVAQFTNVATTTTSQEQTITSLAYGDELELMVAVTLSGVYPNQTLTMRTDYALDGGSATTGTTSSAATVDARTFGDAILGIGASDAAGSAAGVFAHRLLCVARGAGHTIAHFRTYWGL